MKTIYLSMAADIIHQGHINIIKKALQYGTLTVGLLSDKVLSNNKRIPIMNYEQRKTLIENIKGVDSVIQQDQLEYTDVLDNLKPDYVIHGDDWKSGPQVYIREQVINQLTQWGGKLIEVPYTKNISISSIDDTIRKLGISPEQRCHRLRTLIANKDIVRVLEAHNGLSGLIVENARVENGDTNKSFDAMWVSSLCDSTIKGKPDIELVDYTSRITTINEIIEVTSLPIILDGDTGGLIEHFVYNIKTLERLGVSAIIIEDKVGLKKNSLFGTDVKQEQASIEDFSNKIRAGKRAQLNKSFMIIARIESLILQQGMQDAMDRARAYVAAGADGIMIHSKEQDGKEIKEFTSRFRDELSKHIPLVVVPTTYNHLTEDDFKNMECNIVIYANHLIRSAYPAMLETAQSILQHGRSFEVNDRCLSIKEILRLIPGGS